MPTTVRERFWGCIKREKIDRLPVIEWAPWWSETLERWYGEGLPHELETHRQIYQWFGLDDWRLTWIRALATDAPEPASHGAPLITSRDDYDAFQEHLWPDPRQNIDDLKAWRDTHADGDCVVWIMLEGFFWFPRRLLGIEPHLYAFYDHADLMKDINSRLVDYHLECLDLVEEVLQPDFINFAEDLAYNHGPMISKDLFDEFIAPYYRRVVPRIHDMGAIVMMDSDGLMDPAIPWLLDVGIDGVEPLERQAGVDIGKLRREFPALTMLGAYDKMVMPKGREAMRREFERILPAMASGGYLPGCDHQTPPGVSLANYKVYLELFHEYAEKAVADW
jgi:Uroporphyrinogen decarboxylase (URO-D)